MAKKNESTTIDPEVVDEVPETIERDAEGRVMVPYDGLRDAPPDFVKPLSKAETKRREELESVITDNFKSFVVVCYALREINIHMLYRNTHERFSDYCREKWDLGGSRAYQLIDAADVIDLVKNVYHGTQTGNVHNCGQIQWIPENECQARALVKFKDNPGAIQDIVSEAVTTAPNGKMTASHIKKTARRLHLEKIKDTITKTKKKTNQAPKISEEFRKAFNIFLDAINIERANEYKHTDQDEVIKHVRIILEALEAEL